MEHLSPIHPRPNGSRKNSGWFTIRLPWSLSDSLPDEDYTDLDRICRWLENYVPETKPGERIAYHEVTYGWILGELIERVTQRSFEENFKELATRMESEIGQSILDGLDL